MRHAKTSAVPMRRPFWLPASSFYVLAVAVSAGTFFLIWGIFYDGRDDIPWVGASFAATLVLFGAVFLREIVLRSARERYFFEQRKLDRSFKPAFAVRSNPNDKNKFTIEQNAEMIKVIKAKSEAARLLAKFSDAHREVFEICDDYLRIIEAELPNVAVGSPRIKAFMLGKNKIGKLHHYHLMQVVEIESKALTSNANRKKSVSERLRAAEQASNNVETALRYYPEETALTESQVFLDQMIVSLSVSAEIEKADRAEKKGDLKKALELYQNALIKMEVSSESDLSGMNVAEEIRTHIIRLEVQTEAL